MLREGKPAQPAFLLPPKGDPVKQGERRCGGDASAETGRWDLAAFSSIFLASSFFALKPNLVLPIRG